MQFNEFLVYLSGVGVVAVISWLFEDWGWYQSLAGKAKQVVFFAACLVVAFGSQAIIVYVSPAIIESIAPWFGIASALFANVFLGTMFHKKTRLE